MSKYYTSADVLIPARIRILSQEYGLTKGGSETNIGILAMLDSVDAGMTKGRDALAASLYATWRKPDETLWFDTTSHLEMRQAADANASAIKPETELRVWAIYFERGTVKVEFDEVASVVIFGGHPEIPWSICAYSVTHDSAIRGAYQQGQVPDSALREWAKTFLEEFIIAHNNPLVQQCVATVVHTPTEIVECRLASTEQRPARYIRREYTNVPIGTHGPQIRHWRSAHLRHYGDHDTWIDGYWAGGGGGKSA